MKYIYLIGISYIAERSAEIDVLFISYIYEIINRSPISQIFKKANNDALLVYRKNENFEEAVPVLRSYLSVMEKTLGQEHPDIVLLCNIVTLFYLSKNDYKEATPFILHALQIKEKTLGKNHPSVAITLNTLALIYRFQERYDEAESLYQRSLNIVSTSFGNDHPLVAAALNNLAELYKIQGRDEEAESLYQRSEAIQEAGNDKKTTALFQHIGRILSNNLAQSRHDNLERKMVKQ